MHLPAILKRSSRHKQRVRTWDINIEHKKQEQSIDIFGPMPSVDPEVGRQNLSATIDHDLTPEPNTYPIGISPDVQAEIDAAQQVKERLPLNCLPGLKGKSER